MGGRKEGMEGGRKDGWEELRKGGRDVQERRRTEETIEHKNENTKGWVGGWLNE